MPFIPHTDEDTQSMLASMGLKKIDQLFDEIPSDLPRMDTQALPDALSEQALSQLMTERQANTTSPCFIGAGAYSHYIPAVVWELARRGEFYTTYTPYQAEASQGSLQVIFEYQTAMSQLMAMEVSNASMYDGATALSEAILMAVRLARHKKKQIIIPGNLHPHYQSVLRTLLKHQSVQLIHIPYSKETGTIDIQACQKAFNEHTAALVISQPNFFGSLEATDELVNLAHEHGALAIAQVNPMAMALLQPPGCWGDNGADIACGEGQPLGVPLSLGGPYFGFLCTRHAMVRQMPGRLVGETVDANNKPCYTLTLQAREQHIRRAKATSNICTNQGLVVTAATIFMRLLGGKGLQSIATRCHHQAQQLQQALLTIPGTRMIFNATYFNEFVLHCDSPTPILSALCDLGIQGGFDLSNTHPDMTTNTLLICATEQNTDSQIQHYQQALSSILQGGSAS